ncbi:hypothetical protein MHYP_G00106360 [Metynnis hypsauchen]
MGKRRETGAASQVQARFPASYLVERPLLAGTKHQQAVVEFSPCVELSRSSVQSSAQINMAEPPKHPADVPHASTITASDRSSVIAPQVVGSHVEGSVSNNIHVHFHGERNTSSPTSPTSDLERVRRVQAEFKENLRQKLETILEGGMAFKHPRDSSVLTEDDFREHGIEPGEGAIKSELLAHIFLEVSSNSSPSKSYRFLHSSIQAYLAALSVLRSYSSYSINMLKPEIQWFPNNETTSDAESSENEDQETCTRKRHQGTLWELLQVAVDHSLVNVKLQLHTSSDGELKHFLPFLLGLAFNCGQMLLGQLIGDNKQDQDSIQKAIRYIKCMLKTKEKELNHDQSINLLRCLAELRDSSFEEEMRTFMSSCGNAEEQLSVAQCSVLAHLVQVSGIVLEDMDVFRLCSSPQGQCRLISVVRNCREAW